LIYLLLYVIPLKNYSNRFGHKLSIRYRFSIFWLEWFWPWHQKRQYRTLPVPCYLTHAQQLFKYVKSFMSYHVLYLVIGGLYLDLYLIILHLCTKLLKFVKSFMDIRPETIFSFLVMIILTLTSPVTLFKLTSILWCYACVRRLFKLMKPFIRFWHETMFGHSNHFLDHTTPTIELVPKMLHLCAKTGLSFCSCSWLIDRKQFSLSQCNLHLDLTSTIIELDLYHMMLHLFTKSCFK